jgi:hypothetical protein
LCFRNFYAHDSSDTGRLWDVAEVAFWVGAKANFSDIQRLSEGQGMGGQGQVSSRSSAEPQLPAAPLVPLPGLPASVTAALGMQSPWSTTLTHYPVLCPHLLKIHSTICSNL